MMSPKVLLSALLIAFMALPPCASFAASALSPRHTGLEPLNRRSARETMATTKRDSGTQAEKGHTDAYGNRVENRPPEEKEAKSRPSPGAYGQYGTSQSAPPLSIPDDQPPAWSFR
ncbi:MAG: translation initiation factor IF-2 [Desulfovibrio sp.]|jgi:hypothetical protein|nr:translation initiation factor IF-2 [Desulfovibrio sp.]